MPALRLLLLLASLLVPGADALAAPAAPDAPIDRSFGAWVGLDAQGAIRTVEADAGTAAPLAAVVADLVRALAFAPATRDGAPVASEVPVTIGVRFAPAAGGDYGAQLRWARVEAVASDAMGPPRYPAKELREGTGGWAVVGFVVGADGAAEPGSVEVIDQGAWRHRSRSSVSAPAFGRATLEAAAAWRHRGARIDGTPVRVRLEVPTTFRGWKDHDAPLPDFAQEALARVSAPRLLDDDRALPSVATRLPEVPPAQGGYVETTGSRVRR